MTSRPRSCVARRPRALSLLEAMISLAICSSLLVAVAAAYNASANAIDMNDRFYRASQAARVSMGQLLNQIRRCGTCQVNDTYDGVASTVTGTVLHVTSNDTPAVARTYSYDPSLQKLRLYNSLTSTGTAYSLASNVSSMLFTADMQPDPQTGTKRPVRITVDIVVKVGTDSVHLTGSAVPRSTVTYN